MDNYTEEELDNFEARCAGSMGDWYNGWIAVPALRLILEVRQHRKHSQEKIQKTLDAIKLAEIEEENMRKEWEGHNVPELPSDTGSDQTGRE